jgi:hypothetical protein
MASLKEQMLKIHEETDFVKNYAGISRDNEFKYTHGGLVRPGLEYHIHYTYNKEEIYMTGGVHSALSKIIEKVAVNFLDEKVRGKTTVYAKYSDVASLNRENYPVKTFPNPTPSDYRIGTITRYFTQKANNPEDDLFEISKDSFENQSPLFRYISFTWKISGTRLDTIIHNGQKILQLSRSRGNLTLKKRLYALQFWKPEKGSPQEIKNKLDLLKTF